MKNGYYLAAYIEINEMANAFDVDCRRHDQNISLWKFNDGNVKLVRYWELERLTRIKHHNKAFKNKEDAIKFINLLLDEIGICFDDLIEVWGTQKLTDVKNTKDDEKYYYHELCHLYSCLLMNTNDFYNDEILALSVDLAPEELNSSSHNSYVGCWSYKGNIKYFDIESPAILWSKMAHIKKSGEGTLMALSSACKANYRKKFDYSGMSFVNWNVPDSQKIVDELSEYEEKCKIEPYKYIDNYDEAFTLQENLTSATMKVIYSVSTMVMERNIDKAISLFGIDTNRTILALSGGFALNCPCNSYIMNKYKFKKLNAPPVVNDAGQSLGIALYSFYKQNKKIDYIFENAFCGKDYQNNDILNKYNRYIIDYHEMDYEEMAEDIYNNQIVWYFGRSEIGPRALGHRSLLSSPLTMESKDKLNVIKQREKWRPVAPIVVYESADKWFDSLDLSPYMLRTFFINEDKKEKIPAVAHLDNSSRVQTICEGDGVLSECIKVFEKKYGAPIVCNTSLNDRGEPIIENPEEALRFALKKNIAVIYLNGIRVLLKQTDSIDIKSDENIWRDYFKNQTVCEYPLDKEEYVFYYWSDFFGKMDLNESNDCKLIKRAYRAYSRTNEWKMNREASNFYY